MTLLERAVVDRVEIEAMLGAFAHCALTGDVADLDTLLTDDAVIDATAFGGPSVQRADAATWLASMLAPFSLIVPIVGDVLVVASDDATADVESTWHSVVVREDASRPRIVYGITRDRLVRMSDGWRISRRAIEVGISVEMVAPDA
jgi:SnoaL-like domain